MRKMKTLHRLPADATYSEMDSPVGQLTIITSPKGLHAILWEVDRRDETCDRIINSLPMSQHDDIMMATMMQLDDYFLGKRTHFDLPLVLDGTDFQMQAWQQLQKIPYATTISYSEQAKNLGDKNKARAVGMANGVNPISIVIPCHRVVGSKGHLVGFGGGLNNKAYLLALEQATFSHKVPLCKIL